MCAVLLQIKDRHDGNIMLTAEGRLVHIDYGFMLSNAPGGVVHFEVAPWKLTREMMEIMGSDSEGSASEMFDYYKVSKYVNRLSHALGTSNCSH
jgi:phosphatidylinositol 4-kinase